MSLTSLVITAASESSHGEPALSPYLVGAIALGILLSLLAVLVMFGAGREHS